MTSERAVKVIERIRELNLTNREVADAAGVGERAIYRWFSYEREPKLTFIQVAGLCTKLDWTIQELASAYYPPEETTESSAELPGDLAPN